MKCNNCGFEFQEEVRFCPVCGQPMQASQPTEPPYNEPQYAQPQPAAQDGVNIAASKIFTVLKDKLFFVICILMTTDAALSVFGGVDVLKVLFAVFLWIVYSSAQKGYVDAKNLRCVSGTVYANYVIINVACGILAVCGALLSVMMVFSSEVSDFLDEIISPIGGWQGILPQPEINEVIVGAAWLIGVIFVLSALVMLVLNLLGMRKIHRFVKSVYMGVMTQNPNFENPNGVKTWLMVFGVLSGLSALMSLIGFNIFEASAAGCEAAASIISSILIGKYFMPTVDNNIL